MSLLDEVVERETELRLLRDRQDADREMLYLAKYVMRDSDKKPIPDIINVTLNRPAVFAANIIASMDTATQQCIVNSEDIAFDSHYVESFQKAVLRIADQRLRNLGKWPLGSFVNEQVCIRGGVAARCVLQKVNGKVVVCLDPQDYRYTTWQLDEEGLEWGAYGYNLIRPAGQIMAEYGVKVKGQGDQVVDIWTRDHNEVWVGEKQVREQRHKFGKVPMSIHEVPVGSMLQDLYAVEHHGESIFSMIRDVIPELNRLVSIMQTLNLKAVKPPMKAKKVGAGKAPNYEAVTGMGTVTTMDVNEDIAPIDYGDAKAAANLAYGMFDKAMQEGSLNSFDLGTFTTRLSAIALIQIGEGRAKVLSPRFETRGYLFQDLSQMFIEQAKQIGGIIEIDGKKWDTSKLEGDYETTYQYFPKSPQIDMARYQMAASVGGLISERAKRVEILQREDPAKDEDELRWQEAEMLVPAVKLNRIIDALKDMADRGDETADFEAELVSAQMAAVLKQLQNPGQGGVLPTPDKATGQQMIPNFPSDVSTGQKKAANLEATPQTALGA